MTKTAWQEAQFAFWKKLESKLIPIFQKKVKVKVYLNEKDPKKFELLKASLWRIS